MADIPRITGGNQQPFEPATTEFILQLDRYNQVRDVFGMRDFLNIFWTGAGFRVENELHCGLHGDNSFSCDHHLSRHLPDELHKVENHNLCCPVLAADIFRVDSLQTLGQHQAVLHLPEMEHKNVFR